MTVVIILGALVLVWAALGCVYWYATRDLGAHSAPRERRHLRDVAERAALAVSWVIDATGTALAWCLDRRPQRTWQQEAIAEQIQGKPSPFELPFTDWERDSIVMEAIRITREASRGPRTS